MYLNRGELINVVLARYVGLGGSSCLGRFAIVPQSFQFQIKDLLELCEMLRDWDIFHNPLLHNFVPDLSGELIGLLDAVCSVTSESFSEQIYLYRDQIVKVHTGGHKLPIKHLKLWL